MPSEMKRLRELEQENARMEYPCTVQARQRDFDLPSLLRRSAQTSHDSPNCAEWPLVVDTRFARLDTLADMKPGTSS